MLPSLQPSHKGKCIGGSQRASFLSPCIVEKRLLTFLDLGRASSPDQARLCIPAPSMDQLCTFSKDELCVLGVKDAPTFCYVLKDRKEFKDILRVVESKF
eukprot:TRINITY_DN31487_c1_g1_i1.p3 TRINITY_DN31487_c1_g1~~TRINITY_DN31487_c1_g1_i1.p3  ORF type:complete len:100 (+),score=1.14 TRINITY_DN31487_c1_g1_i1:141-440(+)